MVKTDYPLIPPPGMLTKTKKPNYQGFILRQLGHASTCSAPAAFRPLLTEGLVLSGESKLMNLRRIIQKCLKHQGK